MTRPTPSTVKQALDLARLALQEFTDNPQLEADILLCHCLDKPRSFIHAWPEKTLSDSEQKSFQQLVNERVRGRPIAYLTGYREFWGLNLSVTPDTLIPRPETEHLVEAVLALIPKQANWRIADLGTGSGAIALAIANERPNCEIIATDISNAALEVATENAMTLGLSNVRFIQSHWYAVLNPRSFAVICSNPPYIEPGDPHLSEGDLRFEPPSALSSPEQGLADLTAIIQHAPGYLQANGWLLLEHGYQQGPAVRNLLVDAGFVDIESQRDYAALERISLGKFPR